MSDDLPSLDTFEDRLRWVIEEHLMITHAEFARRMNVSPSQLSRWVNEGNVSQRNLARISETAEVREAWLAYGVGSPTDEPRDPFTGASYEDDEGVVVLEGRGDTDPTVGTGSYLTAAYETLVENRQALHQTLTKMGGPGEAEDDKLALIELLGKAVAHARKRGVRLDTKHLLEAHQEVLHGDL